MNLTKDHKFFKRTPWDHQLAGNLKASACPDGFAFFFEPGLGKTFTCINQMRLDCLTPEPRFHKMLIVAPIIVLENWRKEILEYSKFPKERVKVVYGTRQQRMNVVNTMAMGGEGGILITNYKTLAIMPEVLDALVKWKPHIFVLDESHRCKNIKSKQTKAAVKLSKVATKKYLLTGTPILNTLEDVFAQYLIMDGGKTFGKSGLAFKREYFHDKNQNMPKEKHFPNWIEKFGAKQRVHELLKPTSMFVEKSQALDLPPLLRTVIEVELTGDTKKAYRDMLKDFIAFIGDLEKEGAPTAAVANLVLTRALRLQQISTGFVSTETADGVKGIHRFKQNPKKDALEELLSDLAVKSKVIVWAVFKENYKDIREVCESLKINYVEVHGEVSKSQKDESVRAFNEDDGVNVLIGHPASGGIGINLVASDVSVFYSRSFSLENDIQAEARNHRGGSERHKSVTRYDLVAKETIDIDVMKALKEKKSISMETLKGMI